MFLSFIFDTKSILHFPARENFNYLRKVCYFNQIKFQYFNISCHFA